MLKKNEFPVRGYGRKWYHLLCCCICHIIPAALSRYVRRIASPSKGTTQVKGSIRTYVVLTCLFLTSISTHKPDPTSWATYDAHVLV